MGRVVPQYDWKMPRHIHSDFHEIIFVAGGALEVAMRGEHFVGRRGDILTYPAGVWHTERSVGEHPLETFFLAWDWRDSAVAPELPLHATDRNGRAQRLVYWLYELAPPTQPDEAHMLNVLLDALVFEVEQLSRTREQEMVASVKAYVQNHMDEAISLDALAAQVSLSKYYFSRQFKQATGTSPMAFVRQMRVEAARSLLLSTSSTLRAIAQQVGFSDEFQLSRVFRRAMGVPPSQVRALGWPRG